MLINTKKIYSTKNYNQFKILEGNRPINNKSINRIILIFLPITLLSLVNLKFIFIFLIFLYVGYARYFYLK